MTYFLLILIIVIQLAILIELNPNTLSGKAKVLVDSSALMDGRLLELINSGYKIGAMVIPDLVLKEMQSIADKGDDIKKERARKGLELAGRLQDETKFKTIVKKIPKLSTVDESLAVYCKAKRIDLLTTDFNLEHLARAHKVHVTNINHIATSLKPVVLPGEKIKLKISQQGETKSQGIGYLHDSAMIVVKGGGKFVGKTIEIEILKCVQTNSGRMYFAQSLN